MLGIGKQYYLPIALLLPARVAAYQLFLPVYQIGRLPIDTVGIVGVIMGAIDAKH